MLVEVVYQCGLLRLRCVNSCCYASTTVNPIVHLSCCCCFDCVDSVGNVDVFGCDLMLHQLFWIRNTLWNDGPLRNKSIMMTSSITTSPATTLLVIQDEFLASSSSATPTILKVVFWKNIYVDIMSPWYNGRRDRSIVVWLFVPKSKRFSRMDIWLEFIRYFIERVFVQRWSYG